MAKILLVDDDVDLAELVKTKLSAEDRRHLEDMERTAADPEAGPARNRTPGNSRPARPGASGKR